MVTLHTGEAKNTDETLRSTKKWSSGMAQYLIKSKAAS